MNAKGVSLLAVLVLAAACCIQQPKTVRCAVVYDGDTFELENAEVVRLIGIDAPELSQPGGKISQDYLSRLILGKEITLVAGLKQRDRYGRLLRYVYIGSICVNEEMIRNGYAEARYLSEDDSNREYYIQLEIEAENKQAGLWGGRIFQSRSDLNWEGEIPVINFEDADRYYGQNVIVEGAIVDSYNSGEVCVLCFHFDCEQHLTAVIFACDFPSFPEQPEVFYLDKKVKIIGLVREFKDALEVILKTPNQIKVIDVIESSSEVSLTKKPK